ncbi:hypothetical protein TNCV_477651 [Trichonephila clavipes]|nr:hypothetical protein TNCV_477651 [Trichonephila clavipes]
MLHKAQNDVQNRDDEYAAILCNRQSNICLFQLTSKYLKGLTFSGGNKRFLICPEFPLEPASPQHILDCLELDWEDIQDSPLLV